MNWKELTTEVTKEKAMTNKYYYYEYGEEGDRKVTKTIEEIKNEFYPFWKEQVIKTGGENVDLSFERCLDDWIAVNWAFGIGARIAEHQNKTPRSGRGFQ